MVQVLLYLMLKKIIRSKAKNSTKQFVFWKLKKNGVFEEFLDFIFCELKKSIFFLKSSDYLINAALFGIN